MHDWNCIINADHPLHLDRSALAHRSRTINPYFGLWSALMDLAQQRVRIVLQWAREWTEHRFDEDYEKRRARVRFHLNWILDDGAGIRFSFRDICDFAEHPDLRDVESLRTRIIGAFDKPGLDALMKPMPPRLMSDTATRYLYGGGIKLHKPRMRTPNPEGGVKEDD